MSLTSTNLLPVLYHGLATPAPSRPVSPDPRAARGPLDATPFGDDLSNALQSAVRADLAHTDSLSQSKAGQLPVLEHILGVGAGKALCLGAWRRKGGAVGDSTDTIEGFPIGDWTNTIEGFQPPMTNSSTLECTQRITRSTWVAPIFRLVIC